MLIALVVPEKQVLAMRGLELAPVGQRLLDGAQRRVELDVELDAEADQRIDDLLLPLTQRMVYFGWFHIRFFLTKPTKLAKPLSWLWKARQPAAFQRRHGCGVASLEHCFVGFDGFVT